MEKKKLKIAFLSFYSGDVNRGVEAFVDELALRLSRKHEVTVYQRGPARRGAEYKTKRIELGMDWSRRDMTGTIWRRFFVDYWSRKIAVFTFKVFKDVLKEKYDVVVPLNGGYQPMMMRIATWVYGGKLVGMGHSGMGWDERINLLSFPDTFVPLTTKAKIWAKKFNPFVKLRCIPDGVDLKRFRSDGRKYRTKLGEPIILTVGALVPGKRIDLVIRAVSRLQGVSLLVVGDGGWRDKLRKLGENLLGNRYEMIKAKFEEMPSIYRSANLFTLVPDSSEAFGIVYIEALASNLPVVALDDEQRREIVGEAGILVNPVDIESYAKALREALRRDWGDKPRRQAEKFDWDRIAKDYELLFEDLVKC